MAGMTGRIAKGVALAALCAVALGACGTAKSKRTLFDGFYFKSKVKRLDEVPRSSIESNGVPDVVQYRGSLLPLIYLDEILPEHRSFEAAEAAPGTEDRVQVMVYEQSGRSAGLVVGQILDIVQEHVTARQGSTREGVRDCVVAQGHVTEVLDVDTIVERYLPHFESALEAAGA